VAYDLSLSRVRNGSIQDAVRDAYLAELAAARPVQGLLDWAVAWPLIALDPQAQLHMSREIAARAGAPSATLAALRQWDGTAWAMRGAWDSALVSFDRLYAERPAPAIAGARYATAAMAWWTGALDRRAPLDRRADLARYAGPDPNQAAVNRVLAFLDGVVAHADRSPAGIDGARDALRVMRGNRPAEFLERALAAFRLDLDGNGSAAADSLLAIERQRGGEGAFDYYPVPFIRLAAGRFKADAGEAAAADSLLSYYETAVATVSAQLVLKQTAALAAFERARAWDIAGDADRASRFYREFLRMYDMPVAEHRQYVEEAASALARLSGGGDIPGASGR
jgi:hypothetical protein